MKNLRSSGILKLAKESIIKINAFLKKSDCMSVVFNLDMQSLTYSFEMVFSSYNSLSKKLLEAFFN